ncbi:MAG: hypothetical protein JKY53_02970 [Flavobacteriales bacterium]|nr:hypothetical protein [Flavobacteriales bacterium]
MVRNTIIATFVALLWVSLGFAQQDKLNTAIDALTEGNLSLAQTQIDEVTKHPETADLAETWYYRLYIYKNIYKTEQQTDRFSSARDESISALKHFLTTENRDLYEESALKMGKYIASTYYNNAVVDLQNELFDVSYSNYVKYKEAYLLVDPKKQFGDQDVQYQLALANGFMVLYESDRIENDQHYYQAKVVYQNIIKGDSENWNANYNLGILVYNRAVSIIKSMDYGVDLAQVDELQLECVKLFFTALPYMQKSHELNPSLFEPIAGLTGIYFSLHEEDQYLLYKSMLGGNRH